MWTITIINSGHFPVLYRRLNVKPVVRQRLLPRPERWHFDGILKVRNYRFYTICQQTSVHYSFKRSFSPVLLRPPLHLIRQSTPYGIITSHGIWWTFLGCQVEQGNTTIRYSHYIIYIPIRVKNAMPGFCLFCCGIQNATTSRIMYKQQGHSGLCVVCCQDHIKIALVINPISSCGISC